MRAGTRALALLSVPLNIHVLTALVEGPRSLAELRRVVGSPPQTTMRGHLRTLTTLGILERRRQNVFPGPVGYELSTPGTELVSVSQVLQAWLRGSPDGPLEPGSLAAKSAIKALVDGWSSTVVRALAARPLSLTQLNELISGLSYPSLERRLGAMRLAGQITPCPSEVRGTPYAATDWLRSAIVLLAAAANWERQHIPAESASIGRIDIESAFLLTLPTLRLAPDLSGDCRLSVETRGAGGGRDLAGVRVEVQRGRIVSCVTRLTGSAEAWVSGPIQGWLDAMLEGETDTLEIGGDAELAMALLEGLHHDSLTLQKQA